MFATCSSHLLCSARGSWNASLTKRFGGSRGSRRPKAAGEFEASSAKSRFWKLPRGRVSGGSAGRRSMRACSLSPRTPTETRWVSHPPWSLKTILFLGSRWMMASPTPKTPGENSARTSSHSPTSCAHCRRHLVSFHPTRRNAVRSRKDLRHSSQLAALFAICLSLLQRRPARRSMAAFRVPKALGNKKFHPYGDFLLHDIG